MWYSQGPLQHESAYMSCMVPMLTFACRVCTSRRGSKGVESRGMRHHMVSAWQSLVEWILTLADASEERSSALQGSWGRANIATHNGRHAQAPCKMQAHSQTHPQVAAGKCTFQLKLAGNCAVGMSNPTTLWPHHLRWKCHVGSSDPPHSTLPRPAPLRPHWGRPQKQTLLAFERDRLLPDLVATSPLRSQPCQARLCPALQPQTEGVCCCGGALQVSRHHT